LERLLPFAIEELPDPANVYLLLAADNISQLSILQLPLREPRQSVIVTGISECFPRTCDVCGTRSSSFVEYEHPFPVDI
jgi:hypothetical protein